MKRRAKFWFEIFQFVCIIGLFLMVAEILCMAFGSITLTKTIDMLDLAVEYVAKGAGIALFLSLLNYYEFKLKK